MFDVPVHFGYVLSILYRETIHYSEIKTHGCY